MTQDKMTAVAEQLRAQGLRVAVKRIYACVDGVARDVYSLDIDTGRFGTASCTVFETEIDGLDAAKFAKSLRASEKKAARAKAATAYYTRFLPK
jgi:hypothetical protein